MRALVTGASQGIGRATADRLSRDGFELVLHCHRHEREAQALAERVRETGPDALVVSADLAETEGVRHVVHTTTAGGKGLDVLVNNAGIYPRAAFRELTPPEFEVCFRTNVFGAAELTRQLLPVLERSDRGRIIFVSSVLAFTGSRHGAHYAASKAALLGLARSLARELAPGITVNVVAPGSIETAILGDDTPAVRSERVRGTPLARIGVPDDVAGAISFLASKDSAYITGATLHVNGGLRSD